MDFANELSSGLLLSESLRSVKCWDANNALYMRAFFCYRAIWRIDAPSARLARDRSMPSTILETLMADPERDHCFLSCPEASSHVYEMKMICVTSSPLCQQAGLPAPYSALESRIHPFSFPN